MNEIPELSKKELKQFGCILGILIAVVFGLVIPWLWSALTFPNVYIIGIGLGVTIFSLVFPSQVDEIISDLMEMDLSEGTVIVPFNGLLFEDFRVIVFFISNYDI